MTQLAIVAAGSRGDVQPYVALGKGLQAAGFAVRIGTAPGGPYTVEHDIPNGAARTFVLPAKPDGKYYAVAVAKDAAGNVSPNSNEVTFTIDAVAPPAPDGLRVTVTVSVVVTP